MRRGWRSAYHHEVLARGLAPDDVRTMLTQRLRWAQGTVQVMLRENPLVQKGLSIGQRLMYWATMWSYLAGFAALAYIAAPAIYLIFGILPVNAYSWDFFGRLIPFLLLNQFMFIIISRGTPPTWRGSAIQPRAVPGLDPGLRHGFPQRLLRPPAGGSQ